MKNITKKILAAFILVAVISLTVKGQTTVSGGIYANTTWTKANSPYTSNSVVVFPNVTLTIQPGVVVIVNGNLEIRQAKLIAIGTVTDSITFLGSRPILHDTLSPMTLYFHDAHSSKINYCNFKANPNEAIEIYLYSANDSLSIQNSYFTNNGFGIDYVIGTVNINNCLFKNNSNAVHQAGMMITNSIFRKNQNALLIVNNAIIQNCIIDSNAVVGIESWDHNTITNCQIKNNGIGILCTSGGSYNSQIHNNIIESNTIGIQLSNTWGPDSIYCNKICNNTTFNVKATTQFNRIVSNNYWCTTDSATIASSIYDGYDNASYGLVKFMPLDASQCYLTTGIQTNAPQTFSFSIFPNPASDNLTIELPENISKTEIKIYNMLGELEYAAEASKQKTDIDISAFTGGLHIVQISSGENSSRKKFIKQ